MRVGSISLSFSQKIQIILLQSVPVFLRCWLSCTTKAQAYALLGVIVGVLETLEATNICEWGHIGLADNM